MISIASGGSRDGGRDMSNSYKIETWDVVATRKQNDLGSLMAVGTHDVTQISYNYDNENDEDDDNAYNYNDDHEKE